MGRSSFIFLVSTFLIFLLPAQWFAPVELFLFALAKPLVGNNSLSSAQVSWEKQIVEYQAELLQCHNEIRGLKRKLKEIGDFTDTHPQALKIKEHYKIIIADVMIKWDTSAWRKSLILNRGSHSGIEAGLPVVAGRYLVGRINAASPYTSQVQLITDPGFRGRAFTIAPQNPGSKHEMDHSFLPDNIQSCEGILEGVSLKQCSLKWIDRDVKVKPNWLVFSAADLKGIYPKGLIIGRVTAISEEGYFYRLKVIPAVNFNTIESVVVLKPIK